MPNLVEKDGKIFVGFMKVFLNNLSFDHPNFYEPFIQIGIISSGLRNWDSLFGSRLLQPMSCRIFQVCSKTNVQEKNFNASVFEKMTLEIKDLRCITLDLKTHKVFEIPEKYFSTEVFVENVSNQRCSKCLEVKDMVKIAKVELHHEAF